MFYKLENDDYKTVKELFKKLDNNLQIESILERHNGLVFVDNVKKPLTACIYDCQHNFYIAGNVDNKEFNEALKEHMLHNILIMTYQMVI
ncbi:hypothetical protein SAMN02745248_00254 [Hathewaya proteolytica DSM 3090]|uniref:Uncharacterized protein n=1 Tax=Hathewaya proteolytica DSM 3090 TaxID=1121331 RepID=A0A1M6JN70_9CLOT|nr:hypothetical protein [Hathewaya proteolytica]SHJ48165.1 hypothetical protein SAMN02745248_00254 [Hathewaya proteolytica DSM 3090]